MKLVNSVHNTNRSNYLELLPYTYINENSTNHKDLPSVDYKINTIKNVIQLVDFTVDLLRNLTSLF